MNSFQQQSGNPSKINSNFQSKKQQKTAKNN
jgi:hypothetical protein